MNRPTRVQTFMDIAHVFAKRATCMRLNVGAIVVLGRTIVGHGYNGVRPGEPHCAGNDCPGKLECKLTAHAEYNALARASGAAGPLDLYSTDSPCYACAVYAHRQVKRVFFATPYRITDSLDWLIASGVKVYRVLPAGYVMDWETKDLVEVDT